MIFLDTDHLSILTNRKAAGHTSLYQRLDECAESLAVPIICVEEQCKGWLAKIHRTRDIRGQVAAYERLTNLFHFFAEWEIVSFDAAAADQFEQLHRQKIRIGAQDLKIAAVTLTRNARLLSANLRDFSKVPGLHVENWLPT